MVLEGRRPDARTGAACGQNVARRIVMFRMNGFMLAGIVSGLHFGHAVAGAEIAFVRLRLDINAGAANADGRGRRAHVMPGLAEYRQQLAGQHAQRIDEEISTGRPQLQMAVLAQNERILTDHEHHPCSGAGLDPVARPNDRIQGRHLAVDLHLARQRIDGFALGQRRRQLPHPGSPCQRRSAGQKGARRQQLHQQGTANLVHIL